MQGSLDILSWKDPQTMPAAARATLAREVMSCNNKDGFRCILTGRLYVNSSKFITFQE